MLEFRKGDVVVAPGCGAGLVEDIEDVELGGESVQMYRIRVIDDEVRMWVPVGNARVQGIRSPVEASDVKELLQTIRDTVAPKKRATWNRRQRRYNELLMSNDPRQIAALLGELASVRSGKPLSFGERRLFDRAKRLFTAELKAAAPDPKKVVLRLDEALAA